MITKSNIDDLYRKYNRKPKILDERNLAPLMQCALSTDAIEIDGDCIRFKNVDSTSLFTSIEMQRIHAVVEFDKHIALVLPNSIIFINREDYSIHVHLKEDNRRPWWRRIFGK